MTAKNAVKLALFALILGVLTGTAQCIDDYAPLTPMDKMEEILFEAARIDPTVSVVPIGTSSVSLDPIYLVLISNKPTKDDTPPLRVMITARIHGSEPAGMEALLDFIGDYVRNRGNARELVAGMDLYIVPCVNPEGSRKAMEHYESTDGYWDWTGRDNLQGLDMNRDFHRAQTNEVQALIHLFNRIRPRVVVDLHEVSSVPLLTGGSGWWRGAYFDLLVGAGRHPDVYPPLAEMALDIARNDIFQSLKKIGLKGEFYAVAGGSIDSTKRMAATGADYFNLRNALTILIETPGYDRGESNLGRRKHLQRMALENILARVSRDRQKLIDVTDQARRESLERKYITRSLEKMPREVNINGKPVTNYRFEATIKVEERKFRSVNEVAFTTGNPNKKTISPMPHNYVLLTADSEFILGLLIHQIKVYQTLEPIETSRLTIPRGAFIIPRSQESSALAGLILDDEAYRQNRHALNHRCIVFPLDEPLDLDETRQIRTSYQAELAVKALVNQLFKIKEDKNES